MRAHLGQLISVVPRRNYSDFLRNLPKVSGGVSKFGSNGAKPNRFAEKFSKPQSAPQNSPKPPFKSSPQRPQPARKPPVQDTAALKEAEYNKAREALRNKQKKPSEPKPKAVKPSRQKNKPPKEKIKISVPTFISVSNLASILGVPLNKLLRSLEDMGYENMRHNYILDKDNVSLIADEYGYEINMNDDTGLDLFPEPVADESKLKPRPPIVTIMGHVDHGKTTILDFLRKSSIVNKEFGGITQHIGAFSVKTPVSKKTITFLDTPGHSAFLKMRERGANITDIVILVVAADDSVMPQTIEAIKHAKNADVPIIVAINKCDIPGIKVDKVLADLSRYEIDIEDYGGETMTVQVSGKTGKNMDKLEEAVIALSEISDFKAEPSGVASEGWVIESEIAKGMGPIATVLITRGTVKVGDFIVAGHTYCKIRGMKDELGKTVKSAGPSTPVQVWGWKDLPEAGDQIIQGKNESIAKKVCANRISREKQIAAGNDIASINEKRQSEIDELAKQEKINELKLQGFTDEDLKKQFEEKEECQVVKYIVKSDVFGSAEAIKENLEGLGNEEVKATIVSYEAGPPTDSDVDMAVALGAKIVCFNVKVPKTTQSRADKNGVDIKEHNIIYRLIEEVTEELSAKLPPRIETKILGEVDIQGVFQLATKQKKKYKIAGCKVITGALKRSSNVKVIRDDKVVYTGSLSSLKHVKDDINEAKKGSECGLSFDNWEKFEAGDKIQAYEDISHPRFL